MDTIFESYIAGWFGGFDGIVKSFVGEEEETAIQLPEEDTQQAVPAIGKEEEPDAVDMSSREEKAELPPEDGRQEPPGVAGSVGLSEEQPASVIKSAERDEVAEKAPQDASTTVTQSSKSSKNKRKKKRGKGQVKAVDAPSEQEEAVSMPQADVPSAADGDMAKRVLELERTLKIREEQLGRQAEEIAEAKRISDQVMKKNEELVMAKASVSEKDVADIERCVSLYSTRLWYFYFTRCDDLQEV